MALGVKAYKITPNSTATALGSTVERVIAISTPGNAGVVYLGAAGVGNTGFAISANQVLNLDFGQDDADLDLSCVYAYGTGSDSITVLCVDRF